MGRLALPIALAGCALVLAGCGLADDLHDLLEHRLRIPRLGEIGVGADLRAARQVAHAQGPIAAVLAAMDEAGYWVEPGPGYNPKYRSGVWSIRLPQR